MPREKVTKIIDGDTFKVPRKVIRLARVDVPELGRRGGTKAKNQLKSMIQGKTVFYEQVGKSYGRIVAKVKLKGKSINQAMRNKLR